MKLKAVTDAPQDNLPLARRVGQLGRRLSVLYNYIRQAINANEAVATGIQAEISASSGLVLLDEVTVNGSGTLDVGDYNGPVLYSDYDYLKLELLNVSPSVDGETLYIRYGGGGTWWTAASYDYTSSLHGNPTTNLNGIGQTAIQCWTNHANFNQGNQTQDEELFGDLQIALASGAAVQGSRTMMGNLTWATAATVPYVSTMSARFSTTSHVTAFRLYYGSGNIIGKARLWGVPRPVIHSHCVDFDGTDERLQTYNNSQTLGVADAFTVMVWCKPESNDSNTQNVYCHANDSQAERIHLFRDTSDAAFPWVIDIMNAAGDQKTYYFGESLPLDVWYLIGVTWDGTTDTLECFVDGVEVTPVDTTQDDAPLVMADGSRQMAVGGKSMLLDHDGFDGRIYSAMTWSTVLTDAEILYLHDGADGADLDLTTGKGDYASAASLQHWYKCGHYKSPNIGHDFGLDPFDLTSEFGITDDDIVSDMP